MTPADKRGRPCRKCGGSTFVRRVLEEGSLTIRYRTCRSCGRKFTTTEIDNDGRRNRHSSIDVTDTATS